MSAAPKLVTVALAALLLVALPSLPATGQTRDFAGQVASVSGGTLVVENRTGDKVSFKRSEQTRVTGARSSWGALAKGDRVTVRWKLSDSPRVAREVVVRSASGGR